MPLVSIIVPCYNEQATIGLLLESIRQQTYPKDELEVVIADGRSTDRTRQEIAAFQQAHPELRVQVVDNPQRHIPAALNRALEAARGEIIVRLDAHSLPEKDYVARCVEALQQRRGENVGGVWRIHPGGEGWIAHAIAVAAAHPLGVGDAHYRHTTTPRWVDTVPFGAFHRSLLERVGRFDETLRSNEDYEFNARLRQAGGKVWLDPAIRSTYFSRPTLRQLARQYLRYGYWKARMLRRYPDTLRWRQALPPLFVLSLIGEAVLSFWFPWAGWLLGFEWTAYFLVLLAVGVQTALREKRLSLLIGVPLAIATMHLCWGSAFLWSLLSSLGSKS